jgi:hypothetical protein
MYDVNHTTIALVAVLAAALVIGRFASPALAGGHLPEQYHAVIIKKFWKT